MHVLGIDPGQVMGWALLDDDQLVAAGSFDYRESAEKRWELQRYDLLNLLREHEPDVVVCERPGYFKTWAATRSIVGAYVVTEQVAGVLGYKFRPVAPATIKMRATGKGNAKKPAVIAAAMTRYGVSANEHTADAIFAALCMTPAQGSLGDGF